MLEVREFYKDGAAVNLHIERAGIPLGVLLNTGVLELESVSAHGPVNDLEISKKTLDAFGAIYLPQMDQGFSRFSTIA